METLIQMNNIILYLEEEENVKNSQYYVNDYKSQIINLARTTLRNGVKRAKIKEAESTRQSKILNAEGEAEAIKLVNEAADKYFTDNAQLLKKLETVEASLKSNAKIVVPTGTELVNVIGEMAGVMPLNMNRGLEKIN